MSLQDRLRAKADEIEKDVGPEQADGWNEIALLRQAADEIERLSLMTTALKD